MSENEIGFNEGLEYAAKWIETCAPNSDLERVEFANTMAMSIRAAKKPWATLAPSETEDALIDADGFCSMIDELEDVGD